MIKLLMIVALFAIGGAGVGLVGFLSVNPMAFTHSIAESSSVVAWRMPTAAPAWAEAESVAVQVSETATVELAEVRITSRRTKSKPTIMPILPVRLEPCSTWADIGAPSGDSTGGTGVRSVRNLCAGSGSER